jgi:hypothetical protein
MKQWYMQLKFVEHLLRGQQTPKHLVHNLSQIIGF